MLISKLGLIITYEYLNLIEVISFSQFLELSENSKVFSAEISLCQKC